MPETIYVVLRQREYLPGEALDVTTFALPWTIEHQSITASSAADAVRRIVIRHGDSAMKEQDGTYVAVPARSWKPVKVAAVQTVALKLESADTPTKEPA